MKLENLKHRKGSTQIIPGYILFAMGSRYGRNPRPTA